jgi:hypothetical protein
MRLSFILAATAAALTTPALAQLNTSTYTDVNLDACTVVSSDDMGSTWTCPGYKGIPVMIAEGDLRFFVSYGLDSSDEKAATQTLPPFNNLGPKIEWRLGKATGELKPFATILRYFVQRQEGEDQGQILVVTKVEQGATCHVAYIDALANPDANELARKTADDLAPNFDCENEPKIVGDFEAWER